MHYYTFNIGDYASHTRGLSVIEDAAYRRLIDQYYLSEGPIHGDTKSIARSIGMREYQDDVQYVLETYFVKDGDAWRHDRCDRDISAIRERQLGQPRRYSTEYEKNKALLLSEHDGTCFYCNDESGPFEIDHIFPLSKGGDDSIDNLVVACRTCNRSKGAKILSEWRAFSG